MQDGFAVPAQQVLMHGFPYSLEGMVLTGKRVFPHTAPITLLFGAVRSSQEQGRGRTKILTQLKCVSNCDKFQADGQCNSTFRATMMRRSSLLDKTTHGESPADL
jgi:hypothetical protein